MAIRGVVFDVDGTVLRGDAALPGAAAGLAAVADAGLRRLFVTNNPTRTPAAYAERFARAGFDVAPSEVLTAGTVTVRYLRERHAGDRTYLIGEAGLRDQLSAAGQRLVDDPAAAEVVVASIDRSFDYETLSRALWALADDGVPLVGTDPDAVIPAADADRPGSGAIIEAVASVAGRAPDAVLGKPSRLARELVLDRLDLSPAECLVVGDRLDTDVALGAEAGMRTALVRSGVTDDAALARSTVRPDHVLDSLADLPDLLSD
jgi:4-nitrophenyl phosphatase